MKKLGNISRRVSLWALVLAIAALCFAIAFLPYASSAKADDESVEYIEPPEAAVTYLIGDGTVNGTFEVNSDATEYRYRSLEAGYNAAVDKAKELQRAAEENVNVKVVLAANWTAAITESSNRVPVFGEGSGFLLGRIFVPTDAHIIFDLNGHVVNRGLVSKLDNVYNELSVTAYSDGNVFYVQGELMVADSDRSADSGLTFNGGNIRGGVITGGAAGSGGGIYVADYGKLSIYGGTVCGNYALSMGGGIALMSNTEFNMYYGNIINNRSNRNGGGISTDNCIFTVYNGNISYNTAEENGGGIYSYGAYAVITDEYGNDTPISFLEFYNANITYNKAKNGYGGALYFGDVEVYTYESVVITNNTHGVYGYGAIYNSMYVQGSLQIKDNSYDNLILKNENGIWVSDSFNEDAEIWLSNIEISIGGYDGNGKNLDEDGLLINPETYFKADGNISAYHLLRNGNYYVLSQYYVEWFLWETEGAPVNNKVEYKSKYNYESFDNPYMLTFAFVDYNSADNNHRTGITGTVYTKDSRGNRTDVDEDLVAAVSVPGSPGTYNYAPITDSNNNIVVSDNYKGQIEYDGTTFIIQIRATAKSLEDSDITVDWELSDAAKALRFGVAQSSSGQIFAIKKLDVSDFTKFVVKDGADELTLNTDYTVDFTVDSVLEDSYIKITGKKYYTGTKTIVIKISENTTASYDFVEWQYNSNLLSENGTIEYTGTDLSQKIRLAFNVEGSGVTESVPNTYFYGYANLVGYYPQNDRGLKFKLYSVSDSGAKTAVTEIVNAGKYRIEFDLNGSTPNVSKNNINIDESNAAINFEVVCKEIDFTEVGFDTGETNLTNAELADGIAVALKSDSSKIIDFLKSGESFVVNGTKEYVSDENKHYVYSYGEELVLVINNAFTVNERSATFVIGGVDIAREVAAGNCIITLNHQGGDVTNASGTEITTLVTLTFKNHVDPAYDDESHNSRGG